MKRPPRMVDIGDRDGYAQDRIRSRAAPPADTGLRAICLIEDVGDTEPFRIVPVVQCRGHAATEEDAMAARVKWANAALFHILTREVSAEFAPYNAVVRIRHTEDLRRDYLAVIKDIPPQASHHPGTCDTGT